MSKPRKSIKISKLHIWYASLTVLIAVGVSAGVQVFSQGLVITNGLRYWRWGGRGLCLGAEKT